MVDAVSRIQRFGFTQPIGKIERWDVEEENDCVNKKVNELLCIYITCRAAPNFFRGEC